MRNRALHIVCLLAIQLGQLLLPFSEGNAIPMHRCNGRIQYRPCAIQQNASRVSRIGQTSNDKYATLLSSEFSGLPKQEGLWRGSVAGNGRVHLRLVIKKNGIVQSSRYMGNVELADKATTFAFRSVTPKGKDWSWDIVAYNG